MEQDPLGRDPHTPGAKLDDGKLRVDLVFNGFPLALQEVARVATFGARKYTENGWKEVPDGVKRYTAAMDRHRLREAMGEDIDPDSRLMHAAHLAWNALARLEMLLWEEAAACVAPPKGYALISEEALRAWGKLEEVKGMCRHPTEVGRERA